MNQEGRDSKAALPKQEFVPSSTRGYSHWLSVGLAVLIVAALALAIALPELLQSCCASNEASAISSMRNIVTSQITYHATTGEGRYAPDLATLSSQKLLDSLLGSGRKNGYMYFLTGDGSKFSIVTRPEVYNTGLGTRSFFSDETGVLRFTAEDRPATAEDDPL